MPDRNQSILMGGLVVALLSTSYLSFINVLCCIGVIAGAAVAVWHYTDMNEATLTGGQGAVMGLMAALLGFVIATILNFVLIKLGIRHDQAVGEFMFNQFGANMPPEQADEMRRQLDAPFEVGTYLVNALWGIPISIAFGSLGGMIGAKMFKKGGDDPTFVDGKRVDQSEPEPGEGDSF